ncbi:MAG: aspartate aminotransferase family protein [Lachnospiraceae bacterium]|nr:aspartate aminotransferase family protein [Lachnospiraceae bacterium]
MDKQYFIDKAEGALLHTYNRYQKVWDHGDGVYLFDTDGDKYLDFVAGIAVFALGYGNEKYNKAIVSQAERLLHTSNYFYSVPMAEAAEKITKASGMDRVFFTNSGAEAVEGALKTARRYYYNKTGKADSEIIAMNHSFHGRTMGALSVTGKEAYRAPFEPLIGGVVFAELNDLESVKAKISDKTCAVILETVQGEGGIYPATKEFLQGVRKLCDEHDILLILDEIQCGMGRTGTLYAFEQYGIKPDVLTTAKALGCGVPVGAFLTTEKAAALVPGDHGSTYGGNPLVTAAVSAVLDIFREDAVLDNVKESGAYLYETLEAIKQEFPAIIKDHRGLGLMQGIELSVPAKEIINGAMERHLLLINAGESIIRFVPPLVVQKVDIDRMAEILRETLKSI